MTQPIDPIVLATARRAQPAKPEVRPEAEVEKKREVAKQFEAIFVRQMLEQMNKATGAERSNGSETYHSMYQSQVAEMITGQGRGIGIARMLMKQWGIE
ncbi:MAG: rod-binding protein [Myxococcota bacterium]